MSKVITLNIPKYKFSFTVQARKGLTLSPTKRIINLAPRKISFTFQRAGIKGDRGASGAGVTPTSEELLTIQQATVRKDYAVTTRHASGQQNLLTYIDADGYTNHTAVYGINGSLQFTTIRREFDYNGQHWIYELEHLWTVDGHNGIQINEFSRT